MQQNKVRQDWNSVMYVNVAILKETQPHERRVALVPSVVQKLIKLGARLHMQTGAGDAIKLRDAAFQDELLDYCASLTGTRLPVRAPS